MRHDGRESDALRELSIQPGFTQMATGSALISCGRTRVLCTASVQEGVPPFLKGTGRGWVTAEYAMLPGATPQRKSREFLKRDGRSVEIQRLIGRALRSVCRLEALGERTVYIDCDVLQADGGTRTASITGAFVALCLACDRLLREGSIVDSPIRTQVAAVSVGISGGEPVLDLDYPEDSHAAVDMNIVMSGDGNIVELQGTGEQRPFSRVELDRLLALGEEGVRRLMQAQREALGEAAGCIGRKPRLLLATGNAHKVVEFKTMLGDRFDVMSMKDVGIDCEPEETGATFEENALIKARTLCDIAHCACLADDSGLEVDALGGQPGVYSARFAGEHGNDKANNKKLLEASCREWTSGVADLRRRSRCAGRAAMTSWCAACAVGSCCTKSAVRAALATTRCSCRTSWARRLPRTKCAGKECGIASCASDSCAARCAG